MSDLVARVHEALGNADVIQSLKEALREEMVKRTDADWVRLHSLFILFVCLSGF